MSLTTADVAKAISVVCFDSEEVLAEIKPQATYILGHLAEGNEEVRSVLLAGLRAAKEEIPALIAKIEAY